MSVYSLSDCETKVREYINDTVVTHLQIEEYNASSVFVLDEENVIAVSKVYKNDVEQSTDDWSYDSTTGKVTITFSASYGDSIGISFTCYERYSSTEIENFIKRALSELIMAQYTTFIVVDDNIYPEPASGTTYDDLTTEDKNLVAMVAAILIKPENKSYKLPDFQVTVQRNKPVYLIIKDLVNLYKKDKVGQISTLTDEEDIADELAEEN